MIHCRKTNDTEVLLFNHCSALPKQWDALLPEDHFLKTAHIAPMEQCALPDITHVYVLLRRNDEAVAAAYFQILAIKEYHLSQSHLPRYQSFAWSGFANLVRPRLLVAGHLFRHDVESYYWAPALTAFEAYKLYQAAIRKATGYTNVQAVLVKDMPQALIPYFQHHAPKYLLLRNDISMQMSIQPEWQSLKDYERALKHKYAQRLRKIRSVWSQIEVRELDAAEAKQHEQVIFNLYKQVSDRQQVRLGVLSKEFLPVLKGRYPESLKIWMVYHEGTPVAFFSAWVREKVFDMFYIGLDYAKNETVQLYFNILFFAVEQAILLKKEKLVLGRTALEAKARLGCRPEYLSTFLYIRNHLLRNLVFRLQQNMISMEGEWENRHPLKNE